MEGCRQAAAAGKHILLEKPIARTPSEADEVIAAARQAGVMLMVAHSDRYSPVFRETRRLLDQGALGRADRRRLAVQLVAAIYRSLESGARVPLPAAE